MAEISTQGTTLKLDSTVVAGVKSMGEIAEKTSKIEVTTLADKGRRYINGIKEYGDEIAYKCNYEKAEFKKVRALADGKTHKAEITYPDGLKITFDAYVAVTLNGAEVDGVHEFTISLTPASEVVIGDAAE